jgi:uncharacterized coiled-coil protein SlyX
MASKNERIKHLEETVKIQDERIQNLYSHIVDLKREIDELNNKEPKYLG